MPKDKMKRRNFLASSGLTFASAAAAAKTVTSTSNSKKNVLLYVVDDQGTDDAGCYGNPAIKTPGLDHLADSGTRFTHSFCTTASCAASRSVILSGLYSHSNGMYGHSHACHHFSSFDNFKSLPNQLGEAGYRTLSAGKYHVAPEPVYHFDNYIDLSAPVDMAEQSRELISEKSNRPFFLYFCTTEPHRPFKRENTDPIAPEDVIVPPYLPDTPECRAELAEYYMSVQRADSGLVRLIDILKASGHWDDTLIIYISDNGIAFPGAKTTLYEPGMRLPCVVRDPYADKQGTVTDAMITWADITPTILDFAGLPHETNFHDDVPIPDKMEFNDTIPANEILHGRSFLPVLKNDTSEGWDEIYASHTFHEIYMYYPMRVARERRFKLIWNIAHQLDYPFASDLHASRTWQGILKNGEKIYGKREIEAYLHRQQFELYDLEKDPHEIENCADKREYADILERLKTKLKQFQIRTDDRWIMKWEYE
jgi:N-sulfoglucosamine sulfohydrolase